MDVPSTLTVHKQPIATVTIPDEAYVLSIASLPNSYAISASAPSDAIHLLDKSDPRQKLHSLAGHTNGARDIRHIPNLGTAHDVLISCGGDGIVKVWDERTREVALQMRGPGGALLSCDGSCDGSTVVAGTELVAENASIVYWDPRSPAAPRRVHSSTHSDDVTVVRFSPSTPSLLLSASTDGLLCTSNALEDDEDEAGIHVGNWGCSISKAGWIPGSTSGFWASSDMETFSVWSPELDLVKDRDRDYFKNTDPTQTWVTDYVVDCSSTRRQSLSLFLGSNEGDIGMLNSISTNDEPSWSLTRVFGGKHEGVVRCALLDEENNVLLTGGEDSKLNIWSCPTPSVKQSADDSMDVDPPRKRGRADDDDGDLKRPRMS